MSLEKAKAYLSSRGYADHIIELSASTATVAEAAQALGVQPGMIAKTMSFLQGDKAVLILTEGTAKVDNRKYKGYVSHQSQDDSLRGCRAPDWPRAGRRLPVRRARQRGRVSG